MREKCGRGLKKDNVKDSVVDSLDAERVKASLTAARASQRQDKPGLVTVDEKTLPQVYAYASCTKYDIRRSLRNIRMREVDGRRVLNKEQLQVVKLVATRVCDEMWVVAKGDYSKLGEPLRWCMHGGPGTGMTHVIKILKDELFGEIFKWKMGAEFQIVAFQAVMADLLGGDTVHHALNIGVFGKQFQRREGSNDSKSLDVMKAVLQLRWLIIDEISMVSARLLADIDLKLRSYYKTVDKFALYNKGDLRPFAGLNVLMSGDLWQLPRTDGGFLGDIPCEYIESSCRFAPAPSMSHGQSLIWSDRESGTGLQGVTALSVNARKIRG